jgi:hypothetical protein
MIGQDKVVTRITVLGDYIMESGHRKCAQQLEVAKMHVHTKRPGSNASNPKVRETKE